MQIITYEQFDRACKRQESANIARDKMSVAWHNIGDQMGDAIICIRQDEKRIEMVDNWRDILKTKGKVTLAMRLSLDK